MQIFAIVLVPMIMPMLMRMAVSCAVGMHVLMRLSIIVGIASHRRFLSRLQIEDCRVGLAAASAMSTHHAASISSIDFTFSSSPLNRVNRYEPQAQAANSVSVANSAPQDS